MAKQYSVDYWVDAVKEGDPDRSDYSDDLTALKKAQPHQVRFDGQPFKNWQFYERIAAHPGEMRNWKPIS